ncbi:MAG TPA: excinuclease ABC subunit A [Burkholderiales bacterium]|nr:excinuclease ABC subunit A [Burkholderiales bacterium]
MKFTTGMIVAIVAMGSISLATAKGRDDHIKLPIQGALEKGQSYKDTVGSDIKLFWGTQKTPAVDRKMGEFTSNKKTNAANKSDQEACDLAFISAVIALQQRARKEGGNAVVNIHSVYKNEDSDSPSEFICGAGKIMAGVALRGTVVKLK